MYKTAEAKLETKVNKALEEMGMDINNESIIMIREALLELQKEELKKFLDKTPDERNKFLNPILNNIVKKIDEDPHSFVKQVGAEKETLNKGRCNII